MNTTFHLIRKIGLTFLGILTSLGISSCNRPSSSIPSGVSWKVIGGYGRTTGLFNRPRGIHYDPNYHILYVVDWDGRIQAFEKGNIFIASWMMPDISLGKPEGLVTTPEGTILVADTHYSRVVEFSPSGQIIRMFGSYGTGPGQFVYPIGICMDRESSIYVSEYGGSNTIQKFTRNGQFLLQIGGTGSGPNQFQRPSGIRIGPDGNLYVADAVNHRVQVLTPEGKWLKTIGSQGQKLGQLYYPYDLDFWQNYLVVLEFGNNRLQFFSMEGDFRFSLGSPGKGIGNFSSPWRLTIHQNTIFVSDTNNSRIIQIDLDPTQLLKAQSKITTTDFQK